MVPRQTRKRIDPKAKIKDIRVGDLALRMQNTNNLGKLIEKWDGPFIVIRSIRPGAIYLATKEGEELPHSWNVDLLLKY